MISDEAQQAQDIVLGMSRKFTPCNNFIQF
jgi:hypothetical protein